jgi:hypothetical protein
MAPVPSKHLAVRSRIQMHPLILAKFRFRLDQKRKTPHNAPPSPPPINPSRPGSLEDSETPSPSNESLTSVGFYNEPC